MKPINRNILFKPLPSKKISDGGLIIPDSVQAVNNKGTIVGIGSKVTKVKEGDVCFRVKDWGTEVIINGEKHFIMDENSILAKA